MSYVISGLRKEERQQLPAAIFEKNGVVTSTYSTHFPNLATSKTRHGSKINFSGFNTCFFLHWQSQGSQCNDDLVLTRSTKRGTRLQYWQQPEASCPVLACYTCLYYMYVWAGPISSSNVHTMYVVRTKEDVVYTSS